MHLGAVAVEDERFPPDNTHYFAVHVQPIKILCVRPESEPDQHPDRSYWFRTALNTANPSPFHVEVVRPEALNPAMLDSHEVVVLLDVAHLDSAQITAVRSIIEKGGGLMIAPADQVDAHSFNRLFGDLSPARLERKHVHTGEDFVTVTEVNSQHPILRSFRDRERMDFGSAQFRGYWFTRPAEGSNRIMGFDNGAAAILEKRLGNGRVLLFTSSLDTQWNTLPLQACYLPLLHETLRYLALREEKKPAYTIGEPVPLRAPPGSVCSITGPKDQESIVTAGPGSLFLYPDTQVPGIYTVRAGNFNDHFAVNVSSEESSLSISATAPMELASHLVHPDTKSQRLSEAQKATYHANIEGSQDLWWWLLLLALLVGLGETFLANRTYR
jgi:hypothetical protein